MSMEQKVALTKQIANFQWELLQCVRSDATFEGIGTLMHVEDGVVKEEEAKQGAERFVLGQLASHDFFIGDRLDYDVPRGPFDSSHDWLSALLNLIILQQAAILTKLEKEEENKDVKDVKDRREDATDCLSAVRKLLRLLPTVFPPQENPEQTSLYHHDLHLGNILVDNRGAITAVLDWECVSALPLWMATHVPKFLEEQTREEEPQKEQYMVETPAEAAARDRDDPGYLDNEGTNSLYWIHRMEYEATELSRVYEARLKELWQEWPFEKRFVKQDFLQAIAQCDGFWIEMSNLWADRLEKGEVVRFWDAHLT
jgi:hypothetical protein